MQIAKWGNSLAIRLPAALVRELGLREGDNIELKPADKGLTVLRDPRPEEVLSSLRAFRGRLPASDRLDRDDANAR